MMNAGKYNRKIRIFKTVAVEDAAGFQTEGREPVLEPYASVKTTRGYTLIANGSDFESAYTNFTIRYPKAEIDRDMVVEFKGRDYRIEYLNDVDERGVELEIQAREVTH